MERRISDSPSEDRVITAITALRSELLEEIHEVRLSQATVTVELTGIKDHLARLNGSVARHEQNLQEHNIRFAKGEASSDTSKTWLEQIRPLVFFLAGAIGLMLIEHAPSLVAFIKK